MTKEELDAQAKMLAESQQTFVTSVNMMCDTITALDKYIQDLRDTIENHRTVMDSCGEEFKSAAVLFEAATKVFADGFAAVGENTQKLDKFIARMEAYFGSGTGLEYDN